MKVSSDMEFKPMANAHHGDNPEPPAKQPEAPAGKTAGSDHDLQVSVKDIKTAEATRTNASDGSLADKRKLMAAQDHSIEIVSEGAVSSRKNRVSEKDLQAHKEKPYVQDNRTPGEKLSDFVHAAVKRAEDPESYHRYMQEEIQKFIGIGEGLNSAKEETKSSAVAAWKALNDGTVAKFLSHPENITSPLGKVICTTFDAMAKDPQAANKALEHMGEELLKASNGYTAMSPREKGHVIGKTMFGMVNPEGSTEAGEAALKIADNVATHVDAKVMAGVAKSFEAAQDLAKTAPKVAQHARQMLFDYTSKLHLTPEQMRLAGIPDDYFDGMSFSSSAAKDGIGRSENMLAMSRPKDVPGAPKFPEGGHSPEGRIGRHQVSEVERKLASERAREHATRIVEQATVSEKTITPTVQTMADRSGGKMVGLEHKLKEADSLTRKIETGASPDEIKDALRYTMTFSPNRFTEGVKSVFRQLDAMGFDTVKVKNTFEPETVYKGINCAFKHEGGQVFELQFHTPDSFFVKQDLNHDIYDVARELVEKDAFTGRDVLRGTDDLVGVAKKYQGKLEQYPDLNDMAGHLSEMRGGVKGYAQDFLNALNRQMLDNYADCQYPPSVNDILNFEKGGAHT